MMILPKIEIKEKIDTPYVYLDSETGNCEISGKSYPEDIYEFYSQIVLWFEDYALMGKKDLIINMRLRYFNSSSQKIYNVIFEKLMDAVSFKTTVNWYYDKEDEEILENGKIFEGLTGLKFNYIPY
jgi:hypothetical protein